MANVTGIPVQSATANNYNVAQRRDNNRGGNDEDRSSSARSVADASQSGKTTATRGTIINVLV